MRMFASRCRKMAAPVAVASSQARLTTNIGIINQEQLMHAANMDGLRYDASHFCSPTWIGNGRCWVFIWPTIGSSRINCSRAQISILEVGRTLLVHEILWCVSNCGVWTTKVLSVHTA